MGARKIEKILNVYPELNPVWLMTGEGEMLRAGQGGESGGTREPGDSYRRSGRPHLDSLYEGGSDPELFHRLVERAEGETLFLSFLGEYDFSLRMGGESMLNTANPSRSLGDGDIVACRLTMEGGLFRWGDLYALQTPDGVVIRMVHPSDRPGCIRCVPFNEQAGFQAYDLPVEEISDRALVVGVVRFSRF